MRTTINLDDRAWTIARATADAEQIPLGVAISRLVLAGQAARTDPAATGFPMFPPVPGHIISDDVVAEHRDDR